LHFIRTYCNCLSVTPSMIPPKQRCLRTTRDGLRDAPLCSWVLRSSLNGITEIGADLFTPKDAPLYPGAKWWSRATLSSV
jgi:hypothetical protein